MTLYRRFLHMALLLLVLVESWQIAGGAEPQPQNPPKAVRLLTIGNSFSRNATRYLGDLAAAGGHELIHQPIVVGGASLELHATKAQAHERDPKDPAGRYADGRSLKERLRAQPWDFVTIQQASIKSHDLATYRPFAAQLRDYVREHAPQARLLVHETWAYRSDDPRFAHSKAKAKAGEPATQEAMYRGLAAAYRTIARELEADFIPVGDAFFLADTNPEWGYRGTSFDEQPEPPSLPYQAHSLHVGWRWLKTGDGAQRLSMDGHHANTAGEYLGACVWYEVLFGESSVGNTFVPEGIKPDYAKFLQQTAHQAVMAR